MGKVAQIGIFHRFRVVEGREIQNCRKADLELQKG